MSPRFSNAEYVRRYAAVRQVAAEQALTAVVCYGARSGPGFVEYLTDFSPRHEGYLVVPRQGDPTLFVQLYNHVPDARRISRLLDTRWGGPDSIQSLAENLHERGLVSGRIGLVGLIPFQRHAALQHALPKVEWVDVSGRLGRLRWIKSDEELNLIRRAARLTDKAVAALAEQVRPGMRDCDLPQILQNAVASDGGQIDLAFIASTPMRDPSIGVPAQNLSAREIQRGDVIITEIGIARDGYAGQIQRPFAVQEPPTPEYQGLYDVALEAYQKIAAVIRPGATEQDVLTAADVIGQRGLTICDDLLHGFGGGYLPPILRTRQTTHGKVEPFVFQKNMCIVVQPNVTRRDERMGVQLGQLHVVTDQGLRSLHSFPLQFVITN